MPTQLTLHVASNRPAAVAAASATVREFLAAHGVDDRARYAADLAVEELGTNILSYAFPAGAPASFSLQIDVDADCAVLVFEDDGIPFDPVASRTALHSGPVATATIGGLGIHMVRKATAAMTYSRIGMTNRLEVRVARGHQ
jgi:anti-sigma regulatory factor (Ser/Thr protein kinase)